MTQSIDPFCEEGSELNASELVSRALVLIDHELPASRQRYRLDVLRKVGLVIHENCAEWHPWDPTIYEESE